jgi:hypothetical protein
MVITLSSQPVSCEASRMFCPPRPIACDSCSSCRVVAPRDDVDALAGEFIGDRLHARAAHADAGADRIDTRFIGAHRDLGARSRIAGRTQNIDQPLADLRHLEGEQLDQQLGRGAGDEQLRPARLGAHLAQVAANAVAATHRLARDHLLAVDHRLGIAAEVDVDVAAFDALDDATDQFTLATGVLFDDLCALGLAHLLHDHLLRGLGGDTSELDRLHRLLDEVARLQLGILLARVVQPDLVLGMELEFFRFIVLVELDFGRDHLPAAEGGIVARYAVDGHAHVDVTTVLLARSGCQRQLDGLENDRLLDALLMRDGVDDHQDFFAHSPDSPACPRSDRGSPTRRAWSISS